MKILLVLLLLWCVSLGAFADKYTLNKSELNNSNTNSAANKPSVIWMRPVSFGLAVNGHQIVHGPEYDLMRFLAGSKIKSFSAIKMGENDYVEVTEDKAIITIMFENGSVGSIHYFANGGKSFPKERIEVFCDDAVLQLDNFRKLTGFGWKGFTKMNLWSQDKGQASCTTALIEAVNSGGACPIPFDEILEVARVSVDIAEMLRN